MPDPIVPAPALWFELDLDADHLSGTVHRGGDEGATFSGWFELVALVEAAREVASRSVVWDGSIRGQRLVDDGCADLRRATLSSERGPKRP